MTKPRYDYCPRCEPDRHDLEPRVDYWTLSPEARATYESRAEKWANSLCRKHSRRLRAIENMTREASANEREEARREREGVNQ